ncbi:MAG: NifU family protein [Elusimicrobia bacterium]|nr:NifU family protein [Elusimicrobiota bacterium]
MSAKTPQLSARLASNLVSCRFTLDRPLAQGGWWFGDAETAKASPLAAKLFALDTVSGVKIQDSAVTVTRDTYEDWHLKAREVSDAIRGHLAEGVPAVKDGTPSNLPTPEEIRAKAEDVLTAQINPAVASHGGEITLVDVKGASVYVRLLGGCHGCGMAAVTLRQGVERALRDAIPQLDDVVDVTDHATGDSPYFQGH